MRITLVAIGILVIAGPCPTFSQERPLNQAPAGFIALFNGNDLSGWRGRQGTYSPHAEALLTKDELAAKQVQWNSERDLHWRVDAAKGESVPAATSVHLPTAKAYANFRPY